MLLASMIVPPALAQKKILTGVVKLAGQPVKGVIVYTYFGTSRPTDDLGRYALNLEGCGSCAPGTRIPIFTRHIDYGFTEISCTVTNDYRYDLNIANNPNQVVLIGMVQGAATGEGLPNIDVSVVSDIDMTPQKTNKTGIFKLTIHKAQLEGKNAVRLQAFDPTKAFRPVNPEPQLYSITSFNVITMAASMGKDFDVEHLTMTPVYVRKDDLVTIEASGNIRVGSFVGSSDPDGRPSGVIGMSLEAYNIVPQINHAALMYKIEGEEEWKVAGKRKRFVASRDGHILLEVNDNSKGDNYGSYQVTIMVNAK